MEPQNWSHRAGTKVSWSICCSGRDGAQGAEGEMSNGIRAIEPRRQGNRDKTVWWTQDNGDRMVEEKWRKQSNSNRSAEADL